MSKEEFMKKAKESGQVLGLERMERLCERLGNPQDQIPLIHIAGTNGKGSVSAMIETGLLSCGLKVGKYSSPAVFEYEEMIQVNGQPIQNAQLEDVFEQIYLKWKEEEEKQIPTLFELETAAAFLFFQQQGCSIGIIETGLGGRLDATNVIKDPLISIITSISLDHCQFLGNSIGQIAYHKAGIMKPNGKLVTCIQDSEVMDVFFQEAEKKNVKVQVSQKNRLMIKKDQLNGIDFDCKIGDQWFFNQKLSLAGKAQEENLCLVLAVYENLKESFPLSDEDFLHSLAKVHHPGRLEKIQDSPMVIIDGAHNPDAAKKLRESLLEFFPNRKIRFVIGVFKDKNYEEELKLLLPLAKKVYTIKPNQSRGLDAEELRKVSLHYCQDVENCSCEARGIQRALEDADGEDCIVVCGSLSILKEVQRTLQQSKSKECIM